MPSTVANFALMTDFRWNKKALLVAEATVRLKNFTEECQFNPYFDCKTIWKDAGEITVEEGKGIVTPVPDSRKINYRAGRSEVPDGVIAGVFLEVIKVDGLAKFKELWGNYINDYVYHGCAGTPHRVLEALKSVMGDVGVAPLPDHDKVTAMKIISKWNMDLEEGGQWCEPPAEYKVYKDKKVYATLKHVSEMTMQTMGNFLNLNRKWSAADAQKALMWCIAAKVHPLRLLNFAGWFMTNKEAQPKDFAIKNLKTQEHEVQLVTDGRVVGYQDAPSQFTAGFLLTFAKLTQDIPWFDGQGQPVRLVNDKLLEFMRCFLMPDFAMLGGLVWQPLPLSKEGEEYYESAGLHYHNEETLKEITKTHADKIIKRKVRKLPPRHHNTGNPLFDAQMLAEDNDD